MPESTTSARAVFLSYAREDAEPVRRIADALRAFGVEVWFDQNELRGGDAWDTKIRTQIRTCTLCLPIISATTQARGEGYFRREWKFAVERTHDMAAGVPFLLPVVIDDTPESEALVPEEFMRVQWTRLPNGVLTPQFIEQVKKLLDGKAQPAVRSRPTERGEGTPPPKKKSIPGWTWGALTAVAVGVAAAIGIFRKAEPVPVPPPAPAVEAKPAAPAPRLSDKSIAVLPFTNMSEEKDSAFFTDGMHEDILTNLALVRELRVVSRTSVMSYRGTQKPMKQIAQELGVTYILEGSVRRVGNKVRVTGQLIHAASDEHVWAQAYDRDLTDIFTIQSELSRQIAAALQAALSPEEKAFLARKPTDNPAAYDAYLKGRGTRNRSPTGSRAALQSAEESFRTAVELDPNFAAAWGELAVVHALRIFWGLDASPARRAQGDAAIAQAVRLAPEAPDIGRLIGTYAYYANRDYARATEQYEKAIRLQPNDPTGYISLGLIQRRQGRWTESLANMRKAVELDPGNISYVRNLLSAASYCRRWDEILTMQQRLVALLPGDIRELWFLSLRDWERTGDTRKPSEFLARLDPAVRETDLVKFVRHNWAIVRDDYAEFKRLDEGKPSYPDEVPPVITAIYTAACYLAHGDQAAARARVEPFVAPLRIQVAAEPENYHALSYLGQIEAILGNSAEGLRLLNQVITQMPETRDAMDGGGYRYDLATVCALTGDRDRAIAELAALLGKPTEVYVASIRTDPAFARLRGDPRFEALLNDPKNNAPLF